MRGTDEMTDEEREQAIARYRSLQIELCQELATVGISATSAYHVDKKHPNYEKAVVILLKHLSRDYPAVIRGGIAGALASKRARSLAWDELRKLYQGEPNLPRVRQIGETGLLSEPKDGMADALATMAGHADLDELISLISNPENGSSRIFFVSALKSTRSPRAIDVLASLANDPDLKKEIDHALKKYLQSRKLQPKN